MSVKTEDILLHSCCGPCSVSCVEPIRQEGKEPVLFWYNPNIHPFQEYKARRDSLLQYADIMNARTVIVEDYGLRKFVSAVADNIDGRCASCYEMRINETAEYAAKNGFKAFSTTLLASVYQNHELIKQLCASAALAYGVEFFYKDFRVGFREGNNRARELGLYMQKYCGCIFSEEDRYKKQILKDRERFAIG